MTDNKSRVIYPNLPEPLRSAAIKAHDALHALWTKDAHTAGYDKSKWKKLAETIEMLVRMANKS